MYSVCFFVMLSAFLFKAACSLFYSSFVAEINQIAERYTSEPTELFIHRFIVNRKTVPSIPPFHSSPLHCTLGSIQTVFPRICVSFLRNCYGRNLYY